MLRGVLGVRVPGRSITFHYLQEGADGAQHTFADPRRTNIFLAAIVAAALFPQHSTWAAQRHPRHSPNTFLPHSNPPFASLVQRHQHRPPSFLCYVTLYHRGTSRRSYALLFSLAFCFSAVSFKALCSGCVIRLLLSP